MFHKRGLMLLIIISGLLLPALVGAQGSGLDGKLTLFPNEPCSLEFRGADVQNVLRSLAKPYNVNLLVSQRVGGKITASFHEVPVREVFLAILNDAGLGYVQEGKILRVDTMKALGASKKEVKAVTEPITRHIQVKYAFDSENNQDLTELAEELRKLLGKVGNLSVIKRSNTLVVTDLPENVAKVELMVAKLDKPSKQIVIMSKIISATADFSRELGIQWGGGAGKNTGERNFRVGGGNNTGGWKTASRTSGKPSADDTYNTKSASGTNYAINLPAASVAQGIGGSINLLIGKLGSDILEMQLSAMESESKGKVLASPKVITQDNQAAKMESNHKVFYLVTNTSASGVTTQSYRSEDVKIALEVTPHVIENQIFMDVKVEKGNILANISGPPDIKTDTLTTKVLVASGETIVIGGLIEEETSDVEGGIPWLRDIPLLGWLFSYKTKSTDNKELLIFITPTILQEGRQTVDVSVSAGAGT